MNASAESPAGRAPIRLLAVGGLVTLFGAWPFFAPRSFFDKVATYPEYNEHLFHDIGAFLMGLGIALLAAAKWRDGLTVALAANASAAVLHAIAHIRDRGLGGKASDPWVLSIVALLFVVPAVKRIRRKP